MVGLRAAGRQNDVLQGRILNPTMTDRDDPGSAPEIKWLEAGRGLEEAF